LSSRWTHSVIEIGDDGISAWTEGESHSYEGERKQERTEFSIPREQVRAALEQLALAPFFEGEYMPALFHTDDYPSLQITLTVGDQSLEFHSQSQGADHVPWGLEAQGRSFVVPTDHPAQAFRILRPYLRAVDHEMEGEQPEEDALIADGVVANDDLRVAAQRGDVGEVRQLIARGAPINGRSAYDGEVPLTVAAADGHIEIVRILLERGAEVDIETPRGTALALAAERNHPEVVRLLLDAGANAAALSPAYYDMTPLEIAALLGHVEVVRVFLRREGGAETQRGLGTALWMASQQGYSEVVTLLARAGADLNAQVAPKGRSALMLAAQNGHTDTVAALLAAGADVNARNEYGGNALSSAAGNRYPDIVRLLLEAGADPRAKTQSGHTALMVCQSPEVLGMLIQAGAYVNATTESGITALMIAAQGGTGTGYSGGRFREAGLADVVGSITVLVEAGAKIDARSSSDATALMMAAGRGSLAKPAVLRALLEAGADPNLQDDDGRTALHHLVGFAELPYRGRANLKAVEALLEGGGVPEIRDHQGETVIDLARRLQVTPIVELLEKRPEG
jgi:ankyrin repeat protein